MDDDRAPLVELLTVEADRLLALAAEVRAESDVTLARLAAVLALRDAGDVLRDAARLLREGMPSG